jgi:taurine dioxygenase
VAESEELLEALWAHATQEKFTWHHVWQPGDILIWDNRCVMHHRDPFDGGYRRVMHRIQCAGDVPSLSAAAKTGHPRARLAA